MLESLISFTRCPPDSYPLQHEMTWYTLIYADVFGMITNNKTAITLILLWLHLLFTWSKQQCRKVCLIAGYRISDKIKVELSDLGRELQAT